MTDLATELRAKLAHAEPEVRRKATHELPNLPAPESCDLLVVALGDADWRVRKEAASVAAKVEPRTAVVFAIARVLFPAHWDPKLRIPRGQVVAAASIVSPKY